MSPVENLRRPMRWRILTLFLTLRWDTDVSTPIRPCRPGAAAWGCSSSTEGLMATLPNEWLMGSSGTGALGAESLLRIKELEEQQQALLKSVICAFNQLLDLRDLNTGVHSTRLAEWAVRVATKLGIAESDFYQLEVAALLHDIGKIGVPDAILKKEGKLT